MIRLVIALACVGLALGNQTGQVHLSLGGENEMIVTWTTEHSLPDQALVYYGHDKSNIQQQKSHAEESHLKQSKTSFYTYRASLYPLKPDTIYYYQVGSQHNLSKVFHFRTLKTGADWNPRFAIYGDLGFQNEQSLPYLTDDVENNTLDVIFHIGDFAYDLHERNGQQGHDFMKSIEKVASRLPYLTCPGNHESHKNFSHYDARFTMIHNKNRSLPMEKRINNHFHSMDIGPAHIVMFSTEYYYYTKYGREQIANQYRFLQQDLEKANQNRQERPWIIAFGHRPLYCVKMGDNSCDHEALERPTIRKGIEQNNHLEYGLEELFYKQGVDIQMYGHEHFYARYLPIFNHKAANGSDANNPYHNPMAPIHITTGSAGNRELHPEFNPNLKEDFVAKHHYDYGYTRLYWKNSKRIIMEQVSDDQLGKVVDRIEIVKDDIYPAWMKYLESDDGDVN